MAVGLEVELKEGGEGGEIAGGGGMSSEVSGIERLRENLSRGGVRKPCLSSSDEPGRNNKRLRTIYFISRWTLVTLVEVGCCSKAAYGMF